MMGGQGGTYILPLGRVAKIEQGSALVHSSSKCSQPEQQLNGATTLQPIGTSTFFASPGRLSWRLPDTAQQLHCQL